MSKDYNITAKAGKAADAKSATITLAGPETIEEAVDMYGGEAILSNGMANFTVTMQGRIRADIKAGLDEAAIQAKHASDKMGVSLPKGTADPVAGIKNKWASMDPAARKALLAELKSMAAG